MSVFSSIERIAHHYSAVRARYLTERAIRDLPIEMQKDIGWPDAFETRPAQRLDIGSWAGGR